MPESMISSLKTPEDLIAFFQREFPDSIPLIGEKKLVSDFFANPKTALMSIKVKPPPHDRTFNNSALRIITKIRRSSLEMQHTVKSLSTAKASIPASKTSHSYSHYS